MLCSWEFPWFPLLFGFTNIDIPGPNIEGILALFWNMISLSFCLWTEIWAQLSTETHQPIHNTVYYTYKVIWWRGNNEWITVLNRNECIQHEHTCAYFPPSHSYMHLWNAKVLKNTVFFLSKFWTLHPLNYHN